MPSVEQYLPVAKAKTIILDTPQGKLLGTRYGSDREICVFKGIPYGVPPVGERRWKPCEPAPGWAGVRLATAFSPECVQPSQPEQMFYYRPIPQMSEDCLYLNVWTPSNLSAAGTEKRPVMVLIHGGSLVDGSGSMPGYDGTGLAHKGVVVVTINYRLNVFGYFAHPELTAESSHHASGNYGTTDQIQSLKWVRENIAAFGGDPDNVTIQGESAGALSVSHLLASPLAKGLFHRAIMQSAYLPPIPILQVAEQVGIQFAKTIPSRIQTKTTGDRSIEEEVSLATLRALPADTLLRLTIEAGFYRDVSTAQAVLDNWVFDAQIMDTFEQGKQHDVPLLVGFNSGETYSFAGIEGLIAPEPAEAAPYVEAVKARYGDLADDYLAIYPPDNLREAVFAPARDGFYGWAAEKFAKSAGQVTSNAYLYYFDHVSSWAEQRDLGAFHAAELTYTFNNLQYYNEVRLPNWSESEPSQADLNMAEVISDYWVAFARYGEPRVEKHPHWHAYTHEARHYMAFRNGAAEPGENLLPGAFELHEQIVRDRSARGEVPCWLTHIGLLAPVPKKAV